MCGPNGGGGGSGRMCVLTVGSTDVLARVPRRFMYGADRYCGPERLPLAV